MSGSRREPELGTGFWVTRNSLSNMDLWPSTKVAQNFHIRVAGRIGAADVDVRCLRANPPKGGDAEPRGCSDLT